MGTDHRRDHCALRGAVSGFEKRVWRYGGCDGGHGRIRSGVWHESAELRGDNRILRDICGKHAGDRRHFLCGCPWHGNPGKGRKRTYGRVPADASGYPDVGVFSKASCYAGADSADERDRNFVVPAFLSDYWGNSGVERCVAFSPCTDADADRGCLYLYRYFGVSEKG